MTTWREELTRSLKRNKDSFDDITIDISDEELDREFDDSYGSSEGASFTAWTLNYVYFSREYDGSDYIDSIARHPPGFLEKEVERIMLENHETENNV